MSIPIRCPLEVTFGRTLVELCRYLHLHHQEHDLAPMEHERLRRLLAGKTAAEAADAVWHAGVPAALGVWGAWLSVRLTRDPAEREREWSTEDLLSRLAAPCDPMPLPMGKPADRRLERGLPPRTPAAARVRELKETVFGAGMASDFTKLLAFYGLDNVWGPRGRVIAEPPASSPRSQSDWVRLAKAQVADIRTDDGLRRFVRGAGIGLACAASLAFDSVEVLARKRPASLKDQLKPLDCCRLGLERIQKSLSWSTIVALAQENRR